MKRVFLSFLILMYLSNAFPIGKEQSDIDTIVMWVSEYLKKEILINDVLSIKKIYIDVNIIYIIEIYKHGILQIEYNVEKRRMREVINMDVQEHYVD